MSRNYAQPDFYRFTADSLGLIEHVLESGFRGHRILDLGAGSGVIGIELLLGIPGGSATFVELQRDYKDYLTENITRFVPDRNTRIYWSSFADFESPELFDLIVSNPPYFLPGNGRVSPDPRRQLSRTFERDGWGPLLNTVTRYLDPRGIAVIIGPTRLESLISSSAAPFRVSALNRGEVSIYELRP